MVFAVRRGFLNTRQAWSGARRVTARHPSRVSFLAQRSWGHERISASIQGGFGRRGYHGSAGGPDWDALVYSMMSNIRGQISHSPECFYAACDDDEGTRDTKKERRDMRDLVPLRMNRSSLGATAHDIRVRITTLCKSEEHTPEYSSILNLVSLMEQLSAMDSDNPKLEVKEYVNIFTTIRDGIAAANEMPLQVVSINEVDELKRVKWNAECVWGVAMVNAALRNLQGSRVEQVDDEEGGFSTKRTFEGDLRSMSFKINGLLLDSKDFFAEGDRWFSLEQEERILEAVIRVYKEAGKRRDM